MLDRFRRIHVHVPGKSDAKSEAWYSTESKVKGPPSQLAYFARVVNNVVVVINCQRLPASRVSRKGKQCVLLFLFHACRAVPAPQVGRNATLLTQHANPTHSTTTHPHVLDPSPPTNPTMSSSTQRKTTTAAQAKVDPKETIYERVQLLQKADAQLKLVIGKIRPHPTKLECAEAFDPLLELADNLRADIDAIDMGNVMRKMLLNAIAPCGDSLVLEGWTWEEIKAKDVRRVVLSCLRCISPGCVAFVAVQAQASSRVSPHDRTSTLPAQAHVGALHT